MDTLKVIYIAGQGRSGSTILDRILGTLDGVTSFAEIYRIWQDGFVDRQLCSCGKGIKECEFWTEILRNFIRNDADIQEILQLHKSVDHSRHFLQLYARWYNRDFQKKLDEHKAWMRKLYFTLAQVSGSQIIVDSSKVPSRALVLSDIPGIEVHVVHVVRDVRAVIHAWQKEKFNPAIGATMVKYSPQRTAFFWLMRNTFCEVLGTKLPYARVRYEDFSTRPKAVLQALVDQLEPIAGKVLPFVSEDELPLGPLHTIGGNPHRFASGTTQIRMDTAWKTKLDPKTRRLATLFTYPLLTRYGYAQEKFDVL